MKPSTPIALIGYGYWGKRLYKYLKESALFDLRYVHFPSLKSYSPDYIQNQFGREFVPDINTVWQDENLSNVVIATPIPTHFEVARQALSYGKNVLVEKPLTLNKKDAQELSALALRKNLILETEYTYTYSPALLAASKMVTDGSIGKLESIYISFKQLGRFLPYNVYYLLGSHALSILDLFIPLDRCTFTAQDLMTTNLVVTGGMISFDSQKDHCRGFIDLSLHYPERDKRVVLLGEKGTLVYAPDKKETLTLTLYQRGSSSSAKDLIEKTETFSFDEGHNLKNALTNFHALITQTSGVKNNLKRAVTINAILESLHSLKT